MTNTKPDPHKASAGLQDDRALQYFVLQDDNQLALREMFRTARKKLQPLYGQEAPEEVSDAYCAEATATIIDAIREYARSKKCLREREAGTANGTAPLQPSDSLHGLTAPLHIWSDLLAVFNRLRQKEGLSAAAPQAASYPYFARDVLLACLVQEHSKTINTIVAAYRLPAYNLLMKKAWAQEVDFDDAYQEANINLVKKTFSPGDIHTAQLFSQFFPMVVRRALDQLRVRERRERIDENFVKLSVPERHDYKTYGDYISDKHNLHEVYGKDKPEHILEVALGVIGKECRQLLHLLFYRSYSYQKTAAAMGIKANGIGKRRERCLKKLGDTLKPGQTKLE